MANTDKTIKETTRDSWVLQDLRAIVADTEDWGGDSPVHLTAPEPQSRRGTIEIVES